MPFDGHAYLVKQGWAGKGTGLREGAIARPVTVAQKKTLSGVGKDRDEAFPFWDHVFEAASMSIRVNIKKDDDSDSEDTPNSTPELQRTITGIISSRRPKTGTPALSGTTTPDAQSSSNNSVTPRLSVMAAAKQEAARRLLYANFFRGPVIGLDDDNSTAGAESRSVVSSMTQTVQAEDIVFASGKKSKRKGKERATGSSPSGADSTTSKKRSRSRNEDMGKDEAKEKRRRKREVDQKDAVEVNDDPKSEKKRRSREKARRGYAEGPASLEIDGEADREREKVDRKRRKAEKWAAKEERRRLKKKGEISIMEEAANEESPGREEGV